MSTRPSARRPAHTATTRLGRGVIALGAIIAIAVTVVILSLAGTKHTTTAASSAHTTSHPVTVPLARTHSSSAPPAVLDPMTGQMHGG